MGMTKIYKRTRKRISQLREDHRVQGRLKELSSLAEEPDVGSADWLALCEMNMGGFVSEVRRNKVSKLDPRSAEKIKQGGMTGGDRMIHHNYASVYETYLKKYVDNQINVNLLECGILKGTGLAVWSKLFPEAYIVGLDIDLTHTQNNLQTLKERGGFARREPVLLEFDQFKPDVDSLKHEVLDRKFNVVIDDGFHSDETIINTFQALLQFLARDFVYFAEDNSTVFEKLRKLYPEYSVASFGELTVITPR